MGKKKSFTTSALASLTGQSPAIDKVAPEEPMKEISEPVVAKPTVDPVKEVAASKPGVNKQTKAKKTKKPGLQDPNKRSIKKSHTPVTLYLNATNLDRLKQHAEAEEQKISWLIDEMIYEYLSDKL